MTLEILSLLSTLVGYSSFLTFDFILFASLFTAVSFLFLSPSGLAWALSKSRLGSQQGSIIPGPSGFPLLDLIFTFTGSLTHRALAKLSQSLKATQLMVFSIDFTSFIISSEPETAKDILNSFVFADRPVKESAYELLFHRAMGFAPFGDYWRNLRRISATYLYSPRRINKLSDSDMIAVLWEMIFRGTDTVAILLEWRTRTSIAISDDNNNNTKKIVWFPTNLNRNFPVHSTDRSFEKSPKPCIRKFGER